MVLQRYLPVHLLEWFHLLVSRYLHRIDVERAKALPHIIELQDVYYLGALLDGFPDLVEPQRIISIGEFHRKCCQKVHFLILPHLDQTSQVLILHPRVQV